jgi:hypothetical protein
LFLIEGLQPDTKHNVTIVPQIQDLEADELETFSASIEFTTLAIPCPHDVRLQKASTSSDLYTLLWQPVPHNDNNSIISGYSIYLDDVMVHQILDSKGKFFFQKSNIQDLFLTQF